MRAVELRDVERSMVDRKRVSRYARCLATSSPRARGRLLFTQPNMPPAKRKAESVDEDAPAASSRGRKLRVKMAGQTTCSRDWRLAERRAR